nr:MAG: RNA-dependent RNA polymerase [Jingmen bat picorna-like virus 12]
MSKSSKFVELIKPSEQERSITNIRVEELCREESSNVELRRSSEPDCYFKFVESSANPSSEFEFNLFKLTPSLQIEEATPACAPPNYVERIAESSVKSSSEFQPVFDRNPKANFRFIPDQDLNQEATPACAPPIVVEQNSAFVRNPKATGLERPNTPATPANRNVKAFVGDFQEDSEEELFVDHQVSHSTSDSKQSCNNEDQNDVEEAVLIDQYIEDGFSSAGSLVYYDPYFADTSEYTAISDILKKCSSFVTLETITQQSNHLRPQCNSNIKDMLTKHVLPINLIVNMGIRVSEAKSFIEKVSAILGMVEAFSHYSTLEGGLESIIAFLESIVPTNVVQQSSMTEKIVGFVLIVAALMGLNVKGIDAVKQINAQVIEMGATARGINSIAQVISTNASEIGRMILSTFGLAEQSPISKAVEQFISRLNEHAIKIESLMNEITLDASSVLAEPWKIDGVIRKSENLLNEATVLAANKDYAALGPNIPRLQTAAKALRNLRDNVINASSTRVEPVVLQLYGPPGAGKSQLVSSIVAELSKRLGIPPDTYVRSLTKHWDGYVGQYFIVYDDFLSDLAGEDLKEIIQLVSSAPFIVPMASVDQKGMRCTSPFVILCSNQRDAPLNNGAISNPDAVDRRRHLLVHVSRSPTAKNLDVYTPGASHLVLRRKNPLYRADIPRPGELDYTQRISLDGIIDQLIVQYNKHKAVYEAKAKILIDVRTEYENQRREQTEVARPESQPKMPTTVIRGEAQTIAIFGNPNLGKSTTVSEIDVNTRVDFRTNPTPDRSKVLIIDDPNTPEEIAYVDSAVRRQFEQPQWRNVVLVANEKHFETQMMKHLGGARDGYDAFIRRLEIYEFKIPRFRKEVKIYKRQGKSEITQAKSDVIDRIVGQPAKTLISYTIPYDVTPAERPRKKYTFKVSWSDMMSCQTLQDALKMLGWQTFKIAGIMPLLRKIVSRTENENNVVRRPQAWAYWFNTNQIRDKIEPCAIEFLDAAFVVFNYKHELDELEPLILVHYYQPERQEVSAFGVADAFHQAAATLSDIPTSFGVDKSVIEEYGIWIASIAAGLIAIGAVTAYAYGKGHETALAEAAFTSSDGCNVKNKSRRFVQNDDDLDFLEIAMQLPENAGKSLREILETRQERVTAGYDHYERKTFATLSHFESQEPPRRINNRVVAESQEPPRRNVSRVVAESQEPMRRNTQRVIAESQEPTRKSATRVIAESQEPQPKVPNRIVAESQEPPRRNVGRVSAETRRSRRQRKQAYEPPVSVLNTRNIEREILAKGEDFEFMPPKCTCKRCGTGHCDKVCDVCKPQNEGCIDVGGLDVSHLVSRSIVSIWTLNGGYLNNAVMLAGHIGVTTAHSVSRGQRIEIRHNDNSWQAIVFCIVERRDLAYFRLDKTAPAFRSLLHLLPESIQVDREVGALVVIPQWGKHNMMVAYPVMVQSLMSYRTTSGEEFDARSYNKSVTQGAYANQFTVPGDCGSPIIAIDTAETRKFLGIHSASSPTRAYMAYLSRNEVMKVMEMASLESAVDVLRYQRITPLEHPEPWGENMEIVGTAIRAAAPDKTKLWKTPYAGFDETRFEPAILSDKDPRKTVEKSVIDCLLTKWDYPRHTIPKPEYMERAVTALYNHYATIFVKEGFKLSKLSATQAINSWKGNYMSNPIYIASSAGYPWACLKYKGVQNSGKFAFVQFNEKEQKYEFTDNQAGKDLVESVAVLHGVLKSGQHVEVPFQLHLKDECLKENKIKNMGTRSICASPLDFLIVDRMYLHAAHAAISATSSYGPCMVGINPSSLDWHTLGSRMEQKGPIGFDGDYSAFDSRVPCQMFDYLADFYERLYEEFDPDYKLEDATVRRGIFRCLQNPLLVTKGYVFRSPRGGQPSGQPATSIDNSLINTLYFLYAWQVIHERHPALQAPERFFDCCALAVYGDDNICTMRPEVMGTFTPDAVQDVLNNHLGQKVSDAAKTGLMKWTRLEDMEFLKRTFKKINGKYVGALVRPSFEKILGHVNYKSHHYDPNELCLDQALLQQLVETALREATLHGEEFYNELRDYIKKINAEYRLIPPTRESWQSMFNAVYYSQKMPQCTELLTGDPGEWV